MPSPFKLPTSGGQYDPLAETAQRFEVEPIPLRPKAEIGLESGSGEGPGGPSLRSALAAKMVEPIRAYRAMQGDEFRVHPETGLIHSAMDPDVAKTFANEGRTVRNVEVLAQNPFDFRNKAHVDDLAKEMTTPENLALFNKQTRELMGPDYDHEVDARQMLGALQDGAYQMYEIPVVQEAIRRRGHDAIFMAEEGDYWRQPNVAVWEPKLMRLADPEPDTRTSPFSLPAR